MRGCGVCVRASILSSCRDEAQWRAQDRHFYIQLDITKWLHGLKSDWGLRLDLSAVLRYRPQAFL